MKTFFVGCILSFMGITTTVVLNTKGKAEIQVPKIFDKPKIYEPCACLEISALLDTAAQLSCKFDSTLEESNQLRHKAQKTE